eukprot:156980-Prorocentrum_minimum.AAC.3
MQTYRPGILASIRRGPLGVSVVERMGGDELCGAPVVLASCTQQSPHHCDPQVGGTRVDHISSVSSSNATEVANGDGSGAHA